MYNSVLFDSAFVLFITPCLFARAVDTRIKRHSAALQVELLIASVYVDSLFLRKETFSLTLNSIMQSC